MTQRANLTTDPSAPPAALARQEDAGQMQNEEDQSRVAPPVDCVAPTGSTAEKPRGEVTAAERTDPEPGSWDDPQRWRDCCNVLLAQLRRHQRLTFLERLLFLCGFHECHLCYRWRGLGGECCGRCRRAIKRDSEVIRARAEELKS